ncbi:FAD-dependent oxidoreductase [Plectonema cf. radiosum LEGE 06105]|uniref:FAD-dependent oxidoreductase n=1 Tax=Plectonema cf. radiosum LEGE 06105 TaxID=945769 RepID=A0A8J7JTB5_9CYAN|nr:FAD-dependent oxidoreductase [Plectonema radiosum]MBE9211945.1 FAD-dependent oxidoreductase [Plectonema cf. radiosum LEGE 06105]
MRIAIIGGGASGLVTAYLLNKQNHHVTVFEKQPILGGHIRTLNQNVKCDRHGCEEFLEGGVLEFPSNFHNFVNLMKELEVDLEPVDLGSTLCFKNGHHIHSASAIRNNFTGLQRLIEYLKLDGLYARSIGIWLKSHFAQIRELHNRSVSCYFKNPSIGNIWIKLLTMYSYSMHFELINDFPAELDILSLRDYIFTDWFRIKGGVYSYIEKILERLKGNILLNINITDISRMADGVKIELSNGATYKFDKVVFATPPDRVLKLLLDPTVAEIRRFSAWENNQIVTLIHTDTSMYEQYGIRQPSEFDFFETATGWGYNAYLNQLCGISSEVKYNLAFNLESLINRDQVIQRLEHDTPLYTVESFRYRDEVIDTNGENHTYHAGAYLGDGLHEGAIASAIRVAQLIG